MCYNYHKHELGWVPRAPFQQSTRMDQKESKTKCLGAQTPLYHSGAWVRSGRIAKGLIRWRSWHPWDISVIYMHICGAGKEGYIICVIIGYKLIVHKSFLLTGALCLQREAPETLPKLHCFTSGQSIFPESISFPSLGLRLSSREEDRRN